MTKTNLPLSVQEPYMPQIIMLSSQVCVKLLNIVIDVLTGDSVIQLIIQY